jgi:hypothetical protein
MRFGVEPRVFPVDDGAYFVCFIGLFRLYSFFDKDIMRANIAMGEDERRRGRGRRRFIFACRVDRATAESVGFVEKATDELYIDRVFLVSEGPFPVLKLRSREERSIALLVKLAMIFDKMLLVHATQRLSAIVWALQSAQSAKDVSQLVADGSFVLTCQIWPDFSQCLGGDMKMT